jgi:hypothetical protein
VRFGASANPASTVTSHGAASALACSVAQHLPPRPSYRRPAIVDILGAWKGAGSGRNWHCQLSSRVLNPSASCVDGPGPGLFMQAAAGPGPASRNKERPKDAAWPQRAAGVAAAGGCGRPGVTVTSSWTFTDRTALMTRIPGYSLRPLETLSD